MPQSETPAEVRETLNRCADAYHRVKAELRQGELSWGRAAQENQHKAFLAFQAQMPALYGLESFPLYLACISKGVAIGAIEAAEAGRFCHIAQTAMSAWKLIHLTVPAARKKEQKDHPLPTEGNHSDSRETSGAPAPSHLATRDHLQSSETALEVPEEGHPLPPNGNQFDTREASGAPGPLHLGTRDNLQSSEIVLGEAEEDRPLSPKGNHSESEYIPGSAMQELRRHARRHLEALKRQGYYVDEQGKLVRRDPAQDAGHDPAQTA